MLLDLYQNIAEITHFTTVLASVLGTHTNLASFTRADNQDFQLPSNVTFYGYVHFETTVEANPNARNASAKNIESTLRLNSPPLCVVSKCEPEQERRGCSLQDVGECVQCPMGTYALQNMTSCSSCPLHSTSPLGSTQVSDCQCETGFTVPDGSSNCEGCVVGSFKDVLGDASCQSCPDHANSSAHSKSSIECLCNPGFSGPNGGQCTICPAGKYKFMVANGSCIACPTGTYSPVRGATSENGCQPCPFQSDSPAGNRLSDVRARHVFEPFRSTLC